MDIQSLNNYMPKENIAFQPNKKQLAFGQNPSNDAIKDNYDVKSNKKQKKSFYQRHKHFIWGFTAANIAALPAFTIIPERFPNLSGNKGLLVAFPMQLAGFLLGSELSRVLDRKKNKGKLSTLQ